MLFLSKLNSKILIVVLLFYTNLICSPHDYIPTINAGLLKEFNKNTLIYFNCEYERYAQERTNYLHVEFDGIYKVIPNHMETNLGYRVIPLTGATAIMGHHDIEQRIYFNINFKDQLNKFELSDKIGFEFRNPQNHEKFVFLKNTVKISYELETSNGSSITPYIADTLFFDIKRVNSNRNRLYLGLITKHNNNFFLEFYYYFESYIKQYQKNSLKYDHLIAAQFTFFMPESKK